MNITYDLDGLLAFGGLMSIVRFDDLSQSEKEIEIPLLVTAPLDWKNVRIETSDNLDSVAAEVVHRENGPVVKAKIPVSILQKGNVRGELHITNSGGWESDTYMLSIKDTRQHEISPRILKFKKTNGAGFVATAVVKMAGFSTASANSSPEIKVRIGDQELAAKTKLLGKNTFRVELQAKEAIAEVDGQEQTSLEWQIFNGQSTSTMTSKFYFEK